MTENALQSAFFILFLVKPTRAIQVLTELKPRSIPLLWHFFFTKPVSTFVKNVLLNREASLVNLASVAKVFFAANFRKRYLVLAFSKPATVVF
jgi:hypothetical protein